MSLKNEKEQIKSYNKSGTSKGRTNLLKTTLRSLIEIQNLPKNGFLTFLYILLTFLYILV